MGPCEIPLIWIPQNTFDNDKSTLVQVMAWCHQATGNHLNQCWPIYMTPWYASQGHNELKYELCYYVDLLPKQLAINNPDFHSYLCFFFCINSLSPSHRVISWRPQAITWISFNFVMLSLFLEAVSIIAQHWDGTWTLSPSSRKTRTC